MKTLSIDIETYSSVDLIKCGVYKYAESSDFEILLFGYSADDGEVEVMILGKEEHATLLIMDDKNAKNHAKYLGLNVTGTLGVLLKAKRESCK